LPWSGLLLVWFFVLFIGGTNYYIALLIDSIFLFFAGRNWEKIWFFWGISREMRVNKIKV